MAILYRIRTRYKALLNRNIVSCYEYVTGTFTLRIGQRDEDKERYSLDISAEEFEKLIREYERCKLKRQEKGYK